MTEYACAEWRRAHLSLKSARMLLEMDCNASASRAYCAAFYAAVALLTFDETITFTKHAAVRLANPKLDALAGLPNEPPA
jgi:uncharacterized protein (UPF0332 family)